VGIFHGRWRSHQVLSQPLRRTGFKNYIGEFYHSLYDANGFNPKGVPAEAFDKMEEQLAEDRPLSWRDFGKTFFGVNWINHPVSHEILNWMQNLALQASPRATLACERSFHRLIFAKN
jgi:hypothetical protein